MPEPHYSSSDRQPDSTMTLGPLIVQGSSTHKGRNYLVYKTLHDPDQRTILFVHPHLQHQLL
jgi:hypothetical protein